VFEISCAIAEQRWLWLGASWVPEDGALGMFVAITPQGLGHRRPEWPTRIKQAAFVLTSAVDDASRTRFSLQKHAQSVVAPHAG
jgi:hypothetical protein